MHAVKLRRTVALVVSTMLVTSLAAVTLAAPAAAAPSEQRTVAKQAGAEARAEAKAAREAAKQARAEARAAAKAARVAAKAARRAAKQLDTQKVLVCHKPETPAEGTLEIAAAAVPAHLAHGDDEGGCEETAPLAVITCEQPDAEGTGGSPDAVLEEEEEEEAVAVTCDDEERLLVSIDAPETIEAGASLELRGVVSNHDDGDLTYAWSSTCLTEEALMDPTVVASEPATALLVIRENALDPGATCDFSLAVMDQTTGTGGEATVTVEVLALR